jgi:hypothetical protein
MAVIFYAEGEHPSGFVGYRVATTLGTQQEFRQKYFSLSEYAAATAERLAHELEAQWREQAADEVRLNRLRRSKKSAGPGGLITGLRAYIRVGQGKAAHHTGYVSPMFVVQMPGHGVGEKRYSIRKLGFDAAFTQAVEFYALVNGLTEAEKTSVMQLKPARELFTDTLRQALPVSMTAEAMRELLGD